MNSRAQLSDDALLELMREGDEEAFVLLYRRRQPGIYKFLLGMSNDRVVSEDVSQEVFIILARQADRFDPARGSVSSFLYGIARNCLLQHFDRERPYVPYEEECGNGSSNPHHNGGPNLSDPLTELTTAEMLGELRQAILTLPLKYREAVVLCDLQEMNYLDAATVIGCPIGTVRSRLHRARDMLLQKLRPGVALKHRAVRKSVCG